MALTNTQYESIRHRYEERRLDNSYRQMQRKEEVYQKVSGFREIDAKVIQVSMEYGRLLLKKDSSGSKEETLHQLSAALLDLKLDKKKLLTDAGYPYDYLEPTYVCSKCRDTGYIDSEKCSCFRQMEVEFLYDASHIRELLLANNFSLLSYDYYHNEDLLAFQKAVTTCKNFIKNFNSDYRNLFFYGTVGTGKSFLSGCIAKELIDRGNSILYFSAPQLFQSISNLYYEKDKEPLINLYDTIYNCDLLIIDDLGTEMTNEFTRSMLLAILNERQLRHKSIIISSNHSMDDNRNRYSERFFSRIAENFELIRLSGKDIRFQKKLELDSQS